MVVTIHFHFVLYLLYLLPFAEVPEPMGPNPRSCPPAPPLSKSSNSWSFRLICSTNFRPISQLSNLSRSPCSATRFVHLFLPLAGNRNQGIVLTPKMNQNEVNRQPALGLLLMMCGTRCTAHRFRKKILSGAQSSQTRVIVSKVTHFQPGEVESYERRAESESD